MVGPSHRREHPPNTEELCLFARIARGMWLRRNEVVHGGKFLHPTLLVQKAVHVAEEFAEMAPSGKQNTGDRKQAGGQKWSAPSPGWVKLNWDASIEREAGKMGYIWSSSKGRERLGGGGTM
jgi:hypothetical protein